MDWFLYDNGLRLERVNSVIFLIVPLVFTIFFHFDLYSRQKRFAVKFVWHLGYLVFMQQSHPYFPKTENTKISSTACNAINTK